MSIESRFGKEILISDGAMGTMLLKSGLKAGELPELLNFTNEELIEKIHRAYFDAGSDFVSANTFGANGPKFADSGYTVEQVVGKAISIAKKAASHYKDKFVALDVGPLGILMEPAGPLNFDEAYEIYKEIVMAGERAGADFVLFETFTDIYEMKIAILAAKENTKLPIISSLTFESNGRMLMGADPLTAVNIIQDLGISAIGVNCSLGPVQLLPIVEEVLKYTHLPVIVQPNAGLPEIDDDGQLIYDITPEQYVEATGKMIKAGASIIGGCCGTGPEYIKALAEGVKKLNGVAKREVKKFFAASSASKTVILDQQSAAERFSDRIDVTVNQQAAEALKSENMTYFRNEARKAGKEGAVILDLCAQLQGIDEEESLQKLIKAVAMGTNTPLRLIAKDKDMLRRVIRKCNGNPTFIIR